MVRSSICPVALKVNRLCVLAVIQSAPKPNVLVCFVCVMYKQKSCNDDKYDPHEFEFLSK